MVNTRVVATPQIVFTNPIRTTHVRPLMSSITIGGYKNIDVENSKGGHREPSIIIHGIPTHRNGHFVKWNKVTLKYFDLKKDVDPYAHVKVFNFIVKANVETFEEYIINDLHCKCECGGC